MQILNFNLIKRKNTVIYVFTIHCIIMVAILLFLIITGRDYSDFLLRDDGYYLMSRSFFAGEFNIGSIIGPGLPMIFTPIHFFPISWHPFIRLFISQLFVLILLIILSDLTKEILTNRQYFWGALLIVIHPTFVQWTFRTSIDLYLAVMLGGFILYLMKYYHNVKIKYLLISFAFFGYGIFTRPSFILIPFVVLIIAVFTKSIRKLLIPGIILIIFGFTCYFTNNLYTTSKNLNDNEIQLVTDPGRSHVIINSFALTETILKTKQFHKGTIDKYNINDSDSGVEYVYKKVDDFITDYQKTYPDGNFIHMTIFYCKKNPDIFLAKTLLSPIFFFALSSREIMSYILLVITIVYFIISVKGMKISSNQKKLKSFYTILLSILFGYFLLHWITHSYSRYSLAILPYIYVWGGLQIDNYIIRLKTKFRKKV